MKYFFAPLLLLANIALGQVTYVDKNKAIEFKNSSETVVVLATEDTKTLNALAQKSNKDFAAQYKKLVADYNEQLKNAFAKHWSFNNPVFMTRSELATYKTRATDLSKIFFVACGAADEMLAEAGRLLSKKNAEPRILDKLLVVEDNASSIDILPMTEFDAYFSSKSDWEMKQEQQMDIDKKLGKSVQAGDYLKHRQLNYVGFYLSQHALPMASDLYFGLYYLQADLKQAALAGKKAEINQTVKLSNAHLIDKTLLIGNDLIKFPSGKSSLSVDEIAKNYTYPFKVVPQSEIEKALVEKDSRYAVIIPGVRWSPVGYPELLLFYVVDAADGHSVISYADTGSGSNATTANQFEKSQELKAKHFLEIIQHAEE